MIFLFYIKRRIKPNLNYLKNKLVESKIINEEDNFEIITLKQMLKNRFETVNFNQVRSDAERFVFNNEDLSYYTKDLFMEIVEKL